MMNPSNFKIGIGRLVDNVKVFDNSDGSKKVRFTVAEQDNFKNAAGERNAQFVPYEAFIGKDKSLGVYERMHKGDLVEVVASVKNNNYEKNGEKIYGIVLFVEQVNLLEPKAVTDARLAGNAAAAAPKAAAEATADAPAEA